MHFAIVLGEGERRLSPAKYLTALRLAMANPTQRFRHSFRDPTGWLGRSYSGLDIVKEHWDMIAARWASWNANTGNGNRAKKRAQKIADKHATCKWCGQLTGATVKKFCDASCATSYSC